MQKNPKKEQTRALILSGAERTFRSHGYGGAGVDGVAKAAGVTSGAFYAHYKSKAEAFRETVQKGIQDLEHAVRGLRESDGSAWREHFIDFYLGDKRTCSAADTCALQSLTGEVARAEPETRDVFEAQLQKLLAATADGMDATTPKARRREAIVLLATLSGGVSLARAVNDPALSEEIAKAIRTSLLRPRS
ncbi:MAG: TetR family transcriptional regulator [Myxococcaceae bacterium]|nr:TetR family transcriptional regulator [Myxococcaceae bacterium]